LENNQTPNLNPNPEKTEQVPESSAASSLQRQTGAPSQSQPTENVRPNGTSLSVEMSDAEEKKLHNLSLLEAALYVAGRPLDINELCSVLTTRSKKKAEQLMEVLTEEYVARNTAMEILRLKDERYVMQVKSEFTPLIKRLVNRPLLSAGPLKTLSYIAYRQPITSKRVIEVRGQHAYGHVKLLKDMGLVATERNGRSIVLKTTDYFADYFGLTMDMTTMKRDLKRIFGEALKDEPQP
jgi:segregation and condensation protein B